MDSIYTASSGDSAEVVSLGDMASVTKDIDVTISENIEINDATNISNAVNTTKDITKDVYVADEVNVSDMINITEDSVTKNNNVTDMVNVMQDFGNINDTTDSTTEVINVSNKQERNCDTCVDSIIDKQIMYSENDKFDSFKDLQGQEHDKQVKQKVEFMKNANVTIDVNAYDEKTHGDCIGM